MEYKGEGVEALVSVLNDVQNSNLIMVDRKIKSLLKCLAFYDEFRQVLSYCNQGYDYNLAKIKAFGTIGDRKTLRVPRTSKNLVAFVSNLLVEFDNRTADIISFASDYYPLSSIQESFEKLFVMLIEPFKVALVSLVVEGFDDDVKLSDRQVEFVSSGMQQQTEHLLIAVVNKVQESKLSEKDRADFISILEGLATALDTRDMLIIKAIWMGLKMGLQANRLCSREIEKMDESLKMYMVIK